MQVEIYEPTRRDKLRAAAFRETPGGKASAQRAHEACRKADEWRQKHGPVQPTVIPHKKKTPR